MVIPLFSTCILLIYAQSVAIRGGGNGGDGGIMGVWLVGW